MLRVALPYISVSLVLMLWLTVLHDCVFVCSAEWGCIVSHAIINVYSLCPLTRALRLASCGTVGAFDVAPAIVFFGSALFYISLLCFVLHCPRPSCIAVTYKRSWKKLNIHYWRILPPPQRTRINTTSMQRKPDTDWLFYSVGKSLSSRRIVPEWCE